jgi:hypothetical protein
MVVMLLTECKPTGRQQGCQYAQDDKPRRPSYVNMI